MPTDERDIVKGQTFIYGSDLKEAVKDAKDFDGHWEWMSEDQEGERKKEERLLFALLIGSALFAWLMGFWAGVSR